MDTLLTNDTKAIILLCGVLGKDRAAAPLTQAEYTTLARWLVREKLRPEALLGKKRLEDVAIATKIAQDRLTKLLDRGVQLGFAIEEWQRNGLWVISRSDPEYPARYKNHLKESAPPLLFGAGDKTLLQGGGLAIVGSRDVDREGEDFTRKVAEICARNRMLVVSGGARGVDQISMRTALETDGRTIGVLAENLLKASIERHARHALSAGQLLLISPYHPQARFTVGTAMGRNKLIYAMADYGLVVSAEYKKGGTWAGAVEQLDKLKFVPVYVRSTGEPSTGLDALRTKGALPWPNPQDSDAFEAVFNSSLPTQEPPSQTGLGLFSGVKSKEASGEMQLASEPSSSTKAPSKSTPPPSDAQKNEAAEPTPKPTVLVSSVSEESTAVVNPAMLEPAMPADALFMAAREAITSLLKVPMKDTEVATALNVTTAQAKAWLQQLADTGVIEKQKKPAGYIVKQARLFE